MSSLLILTAIVIVGFLILTVVRVNKIGDR